MGWEVSGRLGWRGGRLRVQLECGEGRCLWGREAAWCRRSRKGFVRSARAKFLVCILVIDTLFFFFFFLDWIKEYVAIAHTTDIVYLFLGVTCNVQPDDYVLCWIWTCMIHNFYSELVGQRRRKKVSLQKRQEQRIFILNQTKSTSSVYHTFRKILPFHSFLHILYWGIFLNSHKNSLILFPFIFTKRRLM